MVVRIKEGGTGQVTAPGARIALGLSDQNIIDIVASGGPPGPYQPQDADLTAIAALTTTGYGRGFLTQANSADALTYIGAQPLDSDLTAIAALTTTSYGRGLLTLANNAALVSELSGSFLSLSGGTLTGNLLINGANAASKFVGFTTANSSRWLISSDNANESGANVGSDFAIYRYNDSGVYQGQPLYIQRSTGDVYLEAGLVVPSVLQVGGASGLRLDDTAGQNRVIRFRSSGSDRWVLYTNGTAETGANAGSNFALNRYDDAGTFIDTPVSVNRASGAFQVNRGIEFPVTQSVSTNPNTLDDYEEGTWTPIAVGSTVAGTGTYITQSGNYTKIGRLVTVTGNCAWSAHTGTGSVSISGLPFSISGTATINIASSGTTLPAGSLGGDVVVAALRPLVTASNTGLAVVPIDATSDFRFTATYMTT